MTASRGMIRTAISCPMARRLSIVSHDRTHCLAAWTLRNQAAFCQDTIHERDPSSTLGEPPISESLRPSTDIPACSQRKNRFQYSPMRSIEASCSVGARCLVHLFVCHKCIVSVNIMIHPIRARINVPLPGDSYPGAAQSSVDRVFY